MRLLQQAHREVHPHHLVLSFPLSGGNGRGFVWGRGRGTGFCLGLSIHNQDLDRGLVFWRGHAIVKSGAGGEQQ